MTRIFDVSGRLPDEVVEVLIALDEHFRSQRVRYILVGALARDVVTSYVQGESPQRATKDIDIAVCVSSLAQFGEATAGLDRLGGHEHKFRVSGLEIDVVPLVGDDTSVRFEGSTLDVAGLAEAVETAEQVVISGDVSVLSASVAALCVLKVFAWRDRRGWTDKDAVDLGHLFDAVDKAPYDVWDDDTASQLADFDGSVIGATWLGLQAGKQSHPATRAALIAVLHELDEELALDMRGRLADERIAAFRLGFEEA